MMARWNDTICENDAILVNEPLEDVDDAAWR